jgi:hypothetical protein
LSRIKLGNRHFGRLREGVMIRHLKACSGVPVRVGGPARVRRSINAIVPILIQAASRVVGGGTDASIDVKPLTAWIRVEA